MWHNELCKKKKNVKKCEKKRKIYYVLSKWACNTLTTLQKPVTLRLQVMVCPQVRNLEPVPVPVWPMTITPWSYPYPCYTLVKMGVVLVVPNNTNSQSHMGPPSTNHMINVELSPSSPFWLNLFPQGTTSHLPPSFFLPPMASLMPLLIEMTGRKGGGDNNNNQGSRCVHVSSPRFVFSFFLSYFTKSCNLQVNYEPPSPP